MTEVKISCYFNYTACIFNSLKLIDGSKIPSLQTAVFVKVRRLISFSVATVCKTQQLQMNLRDESCHACHVLHNSRWH